MSTKRDPSHFPGFFSVRALGPALLTLAAAITTAQQSPQSAINQLGNYRAKAREARVANNWRTYLEWANKLRHLLNDSPNSLLSVAQVSVHLGDFDAAFRELETYVRMGQSNDVLNTSPDLAPIRAKEHFADIQRGMKSNESAVSHAIPAFALSDSSLLTEDLDFDPASKRFLITSIREKKIIWANLSGATGEFAHSPDNLPIFAIKIDHAHGLVWATEVALKDYSFTPRADWGRSILLCFNLKSGKLVHRVKGPRETALGDLTLTQDGDVIVSDGQGGGIYRVLRNSSTIQRIDHGDFISPQTPTMHPDGKHVFVPDYLRGIGLMEITTGQVHWLSTEGQFALNGIDGLYFADGKLFAVQNGTSPERVVAFTLDSTHTRIMSEQIIERSTGTLGDPTHGVVIGKDFYYLANSGWDAMDDQGNLKPDAKPSPPRVMHAGP